MAISILLLLPLLFYAGKGFSAANENHSLDGFHVIRVTSILPTATCSSSSSSFKEPEDGSVLKISHRHGPCSSSSLHGAQEKFKTSMPLNSEEFLQHDQMRVQSFHSILSHKPKKPPQKISKGGIVLPAQTGSSLGTGNYIVHVAFGTPKKLMSLIFDTGSDLTWIQCEPCVRFCHDQEDPIFSPSDSSSYSNVTCNTTECSQVKSSTGVSPICGPSANCIYGTQYGDQSYSIGYFAKEKLTVSPTDVFNNFHFGCGQNNRGLYGRAAGLLGLGRDNLSFVSQTFSKYNGRFSYCLPSTSNSSGYLSFGAQKNKNPGVKFTQMIKDLRGPSFYFLDMIAISVAGDKVAIPPSVFASAGTLIDSGTVITRLPPIAYNSLKSAFQKFMSIYPSALPFSILDTCYNLTGYNQVKVPSVSLQFKGGVSLDIDPSGLLIAGSASQVCLAFAANAKDTDVGIIGNRQQQKLEVIYDVARSQLGFNTKGCK